MNRGDAIFTLIIVLISVTLLVGPYHVLVHMDADYQYEVKAEQVNEDEMVDEAVQMENLSEAEQDVLYRAFKKSDHFLGGSEAIVQTDEPLNVSEEWRVVEIKGVPMLVAISGPTEVSESAGVGVLAIIGMSAGIVLGLVSLMMIKDMLLYGEHRV